MKNPLIIGGGLVGLATAWQLLRSGRVGGLTLLEKESRVGAHQSTHNSGVLHAGLYYRPGSLKARLAVEGIREMTAYCREKNIPHEICGKVVVAVDETEIPRLRELEARGQANGLTGLRWLDRDGLLALEPHAAGIAALHVPEEGIVDYAAVCEALRDDIVAAGGRIVTGAEVTGLRDGPGGWIAATAADEFAGDFLVNCAGLHSDRVCRLAGLDPEDRIVPFRGEYYKLRPEAAHLVRHLIYPVPDPKFPFLGMHFSRLIHGGVEAGPNAVLAFAREAYRKTQWNACDMAESAGFPGLWKFLARHPRMAWDESIRSLSKKLFCRSLQRLVPGLREDDLAPGGAGVRAQAISRDGELVQDFRLVDGPRALHVVNAPSPAATACLSIGREIMCSALPRDATARIGYFSPVQKLLLLSLLCLPLAALRAEWIELQDGTRVEGKILSVTSQTVLIEVQTSPSIREEKSYPRAGVAKMQRAGQDDVAFEEIAAISLPATADSPAVYDELLEQKIRPFIKNYAYSKHMPEARKLAAVLEAERARVAAGEVKVDGEWIGGAATISDGAEVGGRVQLSKMKTANSPVAALQAFEILEKDHATSSSYPEAVKLARESVEKLRTALVRTRADLERRTGEQEKGLELASEENRLQMETGIAQEKAAVQVQIDRAKQSGSRWAPVLPDAKVLDELDKLAETEETRLGTIDTETLAAGVSAAQEARRQIEAGQLESAKASLDRAEKLWSQHVLLASLKDSLKKAEEEVARRAHEEKPPAKS